MPGKVVGVWRTPTEVSGDDTASAYNLAVVVIAEMRKLGVLPTPHNDEPWFNLRISALPSLTRRMEQMLNGSAPVMTPALLSELHDEFGDA